MMDTDKDIITVLLKSVFNKGLISEMTYRNSLNRLRTFDDSPCVPYSKVIPEPESAMFPPPPAGKTSRIQAK